MVTGAGGWLGSHLVRWLIKQPSNAGPTPAIFALVRPGSDLARLHDIQASITLVQCDLGDRAELDARLETIRTRTPSPFMLGWAIWPEMLRNPFLRAVQRRMTA